jgi:hypothetical protein
MNKHPERRPKLAKTPKYRATELWMRLPIQELIVDLYPKMKELQQLKPELPLPEPWAAVVKLEPFKLQREQWADIAKLGPPNKLAEAGAQIESAIHLARVMRTFYLKGSAAQSEKLASKRREARKIYDALKQVTDRIIAFRKEEIDAATARKTREIVGAFNKQVTDRIKAIRKEEKDDALTRETRKSYDKFEQVTGRKIDLPLTGEARKIYDALKQVTGRIEAFRKEEIDAAFTEIIGDRDFNPAMTGLRYILMYYLFREFDDALKQVTGRIEAIRKEEINAALTGGARKIYDALEQVTDRIVVFRKEEIDAAFTEIIGDRDFNQAMTGLRYILNYFYFESTARQWQNYNWSLYYLIRKLDFIWKEHTGERVRRSNKSEAYVVKVCRIALGPIKEPAILNALKHYITARRLMGVSEDVWYGISGRG